MSQPADLRAELAAVFAKARAELDQAERRALALLRLETSAPAAARPADNEPEWINLETAAHRCWNCHPETMARRARVHGLGHRVGRGWMIDARRLAAWMEKRPFDPIPSAEMSDIVDHPGKNSDV